MRKTLILLTALSSASCCLAQNKIVLKNGKTIHNAHYNQINGALLEYEQQGSLHDVEIETIDWVEKDNSDHWKPMANVGLMKVAKDTVAIVNTKPKPDTSLNAVAQQQIPVAIEKSNSQWDKPPVVIEIVKKDTVVITKTVPQSAEKTGWDAPPGQYKVPERTTTNHFEEGSAQNTYEQGFADAKKQFHAPLSTVLGFVSTPTLFIWPVGTGITVGINTINITSTTPQAHTSNTNPHYLRGYKDGMTRKKLNNTLGGAGIFAGMALLITVVALGTLFHGGGSFL